MTDISTTWTECFALRNRSQQTVSQAIRQARTRLPFALLGFDSDNGTEFINNHLCNYCKQEHITFKRSRPYKKNGQAHVGQKNWSIGHLAVGYDRDVGEGACEGLAALYAMVRLHTNFFQPSIKLLSKERAFQQGEKDV